MHGEGDAAEEHVARHISFPRVGACSDEDSHFAAGNPSASIRRHGDADGDSSRSLLVRLYLIGGRHIFSALLTLQATKAESQLRHEILQLLQWFRLIFCHVEITVVRRLEHGNH